MFPDILDKNGTTPRPGRWRGLSSKRLAHRRIDGAPVASGENGPGKKTIPAAKELAALRAGAQVLRREEGQSLVEFALAVPLLLLVLTGIAAFGIAFNNYIMLTEATSVGARQLTVSRGQTLDPCKTFSSAVYAAAPMLKQTNMTFTVSLNGTSYTGTTCSSTSTTTGAPANMVLGTNAVVTVTYPVGIKVYGFTVIPTGNLLTAQITELMQ